eukprot:TRINITY_DN238_c0_g1_i1.p1 TRINITY_DN238_c0_g1~~TRINITY_DN238_c0_g1_i1.p1  ORF type:complete len:182 (+),score=41.27 TRINITY_DN238_c0_g1_i1:182-727(+)
MQIFISDLNNNTQVQQITAFDTIAALKDNIFQQTGIDQDYQKLIYNCEVLNDEQIISEILPESATLHLTLGLDGGKKKKKVYKTKKKNKHRHRKEQLTSLKYYQIDKNNKVVRLKKVCPECGAGYFMAQHFDRWYCGRCHTTLRLSPEDIKAALEALKKKPKAVKKEDVKDDKKAAPKKKK